MSVLEKARIFDPASPTDVLYVQFNPNTLEYSAGKSRQSHKGVREQAGRGTEQEQQMQASPLAEEHGASLSVRLFYHTYVSQDNFADVRTDINRIRAFLPPSSGGARSSSPRITFAWGTMTHTGTLESFHVTYQMFAHDGTPVQAEVSISIRGEDPDVTSTSNDRALGTAAETIESQEDGDLLLSGLSWLFDV